MGKADSMVPTPYGICCRNMNEAVRRCADEQDGARMTASVRSYTPGQAECDGDGKSKCDTGERHRSRLPRDADYAER